MEKIMNSKRKIAHGPTVHAVKRAKYEAKQRRLLERHEQTTAETPRAPSQSNRDARWFGDREEYAVFVTVEDVRAIRGMRGGKPAAASESRGTGTADDEPERSRLQRIASWIDPFFDLKEVPNRPSPSPTNTHGKASRDERHFIAEGTEAVRLMIQRCAKDTTNTDESTSSADNEYQRKAPPVRLVSILSKPATFFERPVCLLDEMVKQQCISNDQSRTTCPFKVIVGTEETLSEIVGFPVSRGAMACGIVPRFRSPLRWLKGLLSGDSATTDGASEIREARSDARSAPNPRVLALDAISNAANMGSVLRTAAALGVRAALVSDDSCDAWYRQSVRASMGHAVSVPTIRVGDLRREMREEGMEVGEVGGDGGGLAGVLRWMREEMGVHCFGAVVDDDETGGQDGLPPLVALESISCVSKGDDVSTSSWVCVLGNEGNGIRKEVLKEVNFRVRIDMADGVDSLSLPVAAGILIHGLSRLTDVRCTEASTILKMA